MALTKRMALQKGSKGRGGRGGHFQSKNLCYRIWTFKQGFSGENLKHELEGKMRGRKGRVKRRWGVKGRWGGQRSLGTFPKINLFLCGHPSLTYEVLEQKSWQKLELA